MSNSTGRLSALDVLRGITVAGMILVNDPGSWGAVYAPLCHASWNGLTPTDLVFPFFMFIMGISMYFSLRKYDFRFSSRAVVKIVRRAAVIFLIGLGINWFALWFAGICNGGDMSWGDRLTAGLFSFDRLRIPGVMQRLAIAYLGGALLALWIKPRHYLIAAGGILAGYFVVLWLGNGFARSQENIIGIVDRAVFGARHLYGEWLPDGSRIDFDPEGLFSTLPGFAHVLLGMFAGKMLVTLRENEDRIRQLFIFGTVLVFAGYLLSYACPVNKKIWSPTYVMLTCGAAAQLLALMIFLIDVKGYKGWSRFFEAFGVNPLFMYVLSELLAIVLGYTVQEYLYTRGLASWMDPYLASLVYALLFVLLNWWVARILYERKIYIKI